ncbi:hypothetical protein C8Q79DRAFT_464516 [Trametes meyenii]|nr:hypothetical protein C8Q79DRAFT_464516 [Trametes meyenii]
MSETPVSPSTSPSAPGLPQQVPVLDNTFGAVLVGTALGLVLYGVTLHQSYRYSRMYPDDSRWLKTLVIWVVLLETVTSAWSMHACYFYLVKNYFNPAALRRGSWSIDLFPLASGVTMVSTQSFFVRRVWLIGHRFRPLMIFAVILCVVELAFLTASSIEALIIPTFEEYRRVTWLVSTGSSMATAADLLLTTILIYSLHRSRTGIKRTDSMIDVMIVYSVNTGLLTGILNVLTLIFAFSRPNELIYIGFGVVGTKSYANSLLAALNSRQYLAKRGFGGMNDTSFLGLSVTPVGGPPINLVSRHLRRAEGTSAMFSGGDTIEIKPIGSIAAEEPPVDSTVQKDGTSLV